MRLDWCWGFCNRERGKRWCSERCDFMGGMPIVVLLWGVLVYGAILFIAYKARGDWGTMFGLIFPLSIVFIALFAGMMYVALNFEPLTPILMWSLDPPLLQ